MKKALNLILLLTAIFIVQSCGDDDNDNNATTFEINGTSWRGTGETIPERTITFTSETTYTYVEPGAGGTNNGTYIYDNNTKTGVITNQFGSVPLIITNNILILNYDEGTEGYEDTEGTETFIEQ